MNNIDSFSPINSDDFYSLILSTNEFFNSGQLLDDLDLQHWVHQRIVSLRKIPSPAELQQISADDQIVEESHNKLINTVSLCSLTLDRDITNVLRAQCSSQKESTPSVSPYTTDDPHYVTKLDYITEPDDFTGKPSSKTGWSTSSFKEWFGAEHHRKTNNLSPHATSL